MVLKKKDDRWRWTRENVVNINDWAMYPLGPTAKSYFEIDGPLKHVFLAL